VGLLILFVFSVVSLGIVKVPLQIDKQIVYKEMLVADVEIPALLGYDFTTKNKCAINIPNHSVDNWTSICHT
jgi:hypothetical protein